MKLDIGDHRVSKVHMTVEHIKPHLAGQRPEIVGAVLADLVAIFLASHVVLGNPEETAKVREDELAILLGLVRQLLPLNAKQCC